MRQYDGTNDEFSALQVSQIVNALEAAQVEDFMIDFHTPSYDEDILDHIKTIRRQLEHPHLVDAESVDIIHGGLHGDETKHLLTSW